MKTMERLTTDSEGGGTPGSLPSSVTRLRVCGGPTLPTTSMSYMTETGKKTQPGNWRKIEIRI